MGIEAEFRISKAGVKADLRKQGLFRVYGTVGIPGRNATHLNMDPFLARNDMTLAEHVCEVLFVREGVRQGDLTSNGEGEVACGNRGGIFNRMARPSTFDKAKGGVGHGTFNGSTDTHDDLRGRVAVEFNEGACPMFAAETSLTVGVGETAVVSNYKAGRFDDRGTSLGGRHGFRGGVAGTGS